MPVDQGQPHAALTSLSDAAEDNAEQPVEDGLDHEEESADRIDEAVAEAAGIAEQTGGLGELGRPVNRRSPFFIGMAAAAGVAVTYGAGRAHGHGPVGADPDRAGSVHRGRA